MSIMIYGNLPQYVGSTVAKLGDIGAIVWDDTLERPFTVIGENVLVDATDYIWCKIRSYLFDKLYNRYLREVRPTPIQKGSTVEVIKTKQTGKIYAIANLSGGVKYGVSLSDRVYHEIVEWKGKLKVFSNPIDRVWLGIDEIKPDIPNEEKVLVEMKANQNVRDFAANPESGWLKFKNMGIV